MKGLIEHLKCLFEADPSLRFFSWQSERFEEDWKKMLEQNSLSIGDALAFRWELNSQEEHRKDIISVPVAINKYLLEKTGKIDRKLRILLIAGALFELDEYPRDSRFLGKPIVIGEVCRRFEFLERKCSMNSAAFDYCEKYNLNNPISLRTISFAFERHAPELLYI